MTNQILVFTKEFLMAIEKLMPEKLNRSNKTRLSIDIRVVGKNIKDINSTLERRRNEKIIKHGNHAWYRDFNYKE